jgi:Holliday junction resolvase RusA-like endonuclease
MAGTIREWKIEIPLWRPATVNDMTKRGNHWSRAARLKQRDLEMIACYSIVAKVPEATRKRRVGLEIVQPIGRFPDPDNVWKSLLDALVLLGLLRDDSAKWCELAPPVFTRGPGRTVITLTDLE